MERVSALMDGELDFNEAAREIARIKQDATRRDVWRTYHAIGDALRGEYAVGLSPEFSKRLSEQLALEPVVMAPRLRLPQTKQSWAMAIAASVAGIAVVSLVAMNVRSPEGGMGIMAKAPTTGAPAAVLQPDGPVIMTPLVSAAVPEHMHEYLLAHQGISPSTAIQGVTPYIRTVSNVGDAPALR